MTIVFIVLGVWAVAFAAIQGTVAVLTYTPIYKFYYIDPETCQPLETGTFNGQPCIYGQIAIGREELHRKLEGRYACVEVPAQPWPILLWRNLFPLKGTEIPFEDTRIQRRRK